MHARSRPSQLNERIIHNTIVSNYHSFDSFVRVSVFQSFPASPRCLNHANPGPPPSNTIQQNAALKAKSMLHATSKYRNHELHAMNELGASELGLGFKSSEFSLHRDLGSNFLHLRVLQFLPACKTHLQVLDGADFLL
jgi:hypothetical protein